MADTKITEILDGKNKKYRSLNIRECDNGYILRCEISDTEQYKTTELVVISLAQLLKKVKTYFEPTIVDE